MKKLLSLIIAILIPAYSAFAASSPSDWVSAELGGNTLDMLAAYENGEPDFAAAVTKGEFAKILLAAYIESGFELEVSIENPFSDLNDPISLAAYALALIDGETDTEFSPDKELSRLDAIRCLYSAAEQIYGFSDEDRNGFVLYAKSLHGYEDMPADEADYEALGFALEWSILRGTSKTTLELAAPCTLEQALVMVSRGAVND